MQHPSEVKHAKNTVRLMRLVMPDIKVVVGESAEDFNELQQYLSQSTKPVFIVYPGESSQAVEQSDAQSDCIIILLDGTWRKAYKILQCNPWLLQYPALHLAVSHQSEYIIRKAKRSDSLSTLEATALILTALDQKLDVSPLFVAFNAMVEHRLNAMPEQVKARYFLDENKDTQ